MADAIRLGGNITLEGFTMMEPIKLIVVKKIIGKYAKEMSDKIPLDGLTATLKADGPAFTVHGKAKSGKKVHEGEATTDNLFTAMDAAMKKILRVLD